MFQEVQKYLANGQRKLINFHESHLVEGNYFVHNGIVLLLEKTFDVKKDKFGKEDGRTRIIFDNGTESQMKLRSLWKNLFINGKSIKIDVFDEKRKIYTPREWFIVPIEVIEQAIELIINGKIVNYKFDAENMTIICSNYQQR